MSMFFGPGHSTNEQAVRAAISAMVTPADYAKAYAGGQSGKLPGLATSFVPPTQQCYDPNTQALYPKPGFANAKQILTQAGYTGIGSNLRAPNGTAVTIRINTSPALDGNVGPYLLNALKPLGAKVTLSNGDPATLTKITLSGQADIAETYGLPGAEDLAVATATLAYFVGPPLTAGGGEHLRSASEPRSDVDEAGSEREGRDGLPVLEPRSGIRAQAQHHAASHGGRLVLGDRQVGPGAERLLLL